MIENNINNSSGNLDTEGFFAQLTAALEEDDQTPLAVSASPGELDTAFDEQFMRDAGLWYGNDTDRTSAEYFVTAAGSDVDTLQIGAAGVGDPATSQQSQPSGIRPWYQNQHNQADLSVIQTLDPEDFESQDIRDGIKSLQGVDTPDDAEEGFSLIDDDGSSAVGQALGSAGTMVAEELIAAQTEAALATYRAELESFVNEGKYWFDPRYDNVPELESYLDALPTNTDVLRDSTLTQGIMTSDGNLDAGDYFSKFVFDPVGQGIEALLGPEYDGMAEYVFQKTGERGLQGYQSTGSAFGLLFGLVGVVEGIITWNSALEADQELRNEARKNYYRNLSEYNRVRAIAQNNTNAQRALYQQQGRARRSAAEEQRESEATQSAVSRRQAVASFVEQFREDPRSNFRHSALAVPGRQ